MGRQGGYADGGYEADYKYFLIVSFGYKNYASTICSNISYPPHASD